ncbi:MAG: BatD family protein [Candidatus Gracilibacteria bacterium]|nr:BatD family protein [Candidatus Gracilibacteria bacterium]
MKKIKIITSLLIIFLIPTNLTFAKISNINSKIEVNKSEIGLNEFLDITVNTEYEGKPDIPGNNVQNEKDGGTLFNVNLNSSEIPEIDLGGIENFQVNSKVKSQQSTNINGKQKTQITMKLVLAPKKTGDFNLGPITLLINGQNIDSSNKETKTIKVLNSNTNINTGTTNNEVISDQEIQTIPQQIETDKNFDFSKNLLYIFMLFSLLGSILITYLYFLKKEKIIKKIEQENINIPKKEIIKEDSMEEITKELDKYLEKKAGKSLAGHDIYSKLSYEENETQRKVLEFLYSKINEYKYSGKKLDEDAIKEEIMKLGKEFLKKVF